MATQIIDLDELLGDDKQVKLAGHTYRLPPDLPVELYLKITRFAASGASENEQIETLYDEILGLFRYKQPTLKELPLTMSQLVVAIGRIYGDTDDEGDAVPPPRSTRGGTSSKSRKASSSRR